MEANPLNPDAHELYMRRALRLAQRAIGDTSPNPVVGAVIVNHGRIVGQGYHRQAGLPHAEVEALKRAGTKARGAAMYVTLEPCNHVGRTPPCCDAVIAAGIRRVVIAMKDPNPITHGRGIARLRRAGIHVVTGMLEKDAKRLNAPFTKAMTSRMPWVVAKIAMSLDGKIATRTGESRWISSVASRSLTHRLRRQVDAIMVGVNTIVQDNPLLTARDPTCLPRGARGRQARPSRADRPIKVIVDSHLRTPWTSRCLSEASPTPTIIATTTRTASKRVRFEQRGVEVLVFPPTPQDRVPLARLFRALKNQWQVTSVLLEGGGEVLASALKERLVDRLVWIIAPIIVGGRQAPPAVGGEGITHLNQAIRLDDVTVRRLGPDLVLEASVIYPTTRDGGQETGGRGARKRALAPRPSPLAPP